MSREHSAEKDVTEYVVGFAFDWHGRVALIRKNRPEWQAGRFNGIGGHVEHGERPEDAMEREFREETGTTLTAWEPLVVMDFPGARIHFYRLLDLDAEVLNGLRSMTDEAVGLFYATELPLAIIPNLSWLVPLAFYTADTYEPIHVHAAMAEALCPPPGCYCDRSDHNKCPGGPLCCCIPPEASQP